MLRYTQEIRQVPNDGFSYHARRSLSPKFCHQKYGDKILVTYLCHFFCTHFYSPQKIGDKTDWFNPDNALEHRYESLKYNKSAPYFQEA
jgi:hypothetical protein